MKISFRSTLIFTRWCLSWDTVWLDCTGDGAGVCREPQFIHARL